MSFRCDKCGEAMAPGVRPNQVVAQTRRKEYFEGGIGWEVVKVEMLCDDCEQNTPDAADEARARARAYISTMIPEVSDVAT